MDILILDKIDVNIKLVTIDKEHYMIKSQFIKKI